MILLSKLQSAYNCFIFYDSNTDTINFKNVESFGVARTISTGRNIPEAPEWKSDETKLYNKIIASGIYRRIIRQERFRSNGIEVQDFCFTRSWSGAIYSK